MENCLHAQEKEFMYNEMYRLRTYVYYPHTANKSASELAANGFMYIGNGKSDKVRCYFCNTTKDNWTIGVDVKEAHYFSSPLCPMVTGTPCGNSPWSVGQLPGTAKGSTTFKSPDDYLMSQIDPLERNSSSFLINSDYDEVEITDTSLNHSSIVACLHEEMPMRNANSSIRGILLNLAGKYESSLSNPMRAVAQGEEGSLTELYNIGDNGRLQAISFPPMLAPRNGSLGITASITPASSNGNSEIPNLTSPVTSSTTSALSTLTAPDFVNGIPATSLNSVPNSISPTISSSLTTTSINGSPETSTLPSLAPSASPASVSGCTSPTASTFTTATTSTGRSGRPPTPKTHPSGNGPTYCELGIITERPKRPEYALKLKRLETFVSWPRGHHLTPEELSLAGFYYAGYGDCSRCFYCGGGLRNWDDEDDVWVEHARWFPKCAFVRQKLGQPFIDIVQDLSKEVEQISIKMVTDKLPSLVRPENNDDILKSDPAIKAVIAFGYSEKDVLPVALLLREEAIPLSADVILEKLCTEFKELMNSNTSQLLQMDPLIPEHLERIRELKERNNEIRQQIVCKICLDQEVAVVFLPCGHLISCTECATAMKDCPLCRTNVKGIVRAFIN